MKNHYKMEVHNSATIINDCEFTDYPTLINLFSIWDPIRFKKDYIGVYYDPIEKRLFIPKGIDIDYIKRKVLSNYTDISQFSIGTFSNHEYRKNKFPIRMKLKPRDDVQKEALKFVLCEDQYRINSTRSQFMLNLNTGKGKTWVCACVLCFYGIRTMIITAQSGILDQWKERLLQYTDIDESEIVKLEGSNTINRILSNSSAISDKAVYLCTHSTLHSYASSHGWESIGDLFKALNIGIKIFDEAHQNFQNMALIDFATRDTWRTYYVTATPARSDSKENQIYKSYMKNIPSIDLFNPEMDPHTNYIAIKYNSNPKPSEIIACKTSRYGLSNPKYIEYLMKNKNFWVMFDYIFALIYRTGGRALFYIGTNDAILKVRDRILYNYPELFNSIGIYTSISENKQSEKEKKYILTTTKSAGAGEDIAHLKYSVVLAEPFKSEVLARQTLGRTRDPNTTYIELVDLGFKQLAAYYNYKKSIFNKYAAECKVMNVNNPMVYNLQEETKQHIMNRFKSCIENNVHDLPAVEFLDLQGKKLPAVYFAGSNNDEV